MGSLSMAEDKKMEFHEVETKYRTDGDKVYAFKQLAQDMEGMKEFIYVESDDVYYTNEAGEFLRYRFSNSKKDKRAELTYKSKTDEAHNIIRMEVNLRVDPNDKETVEAFANALGYKKNFRISKIVHIYRFDDATLPFYTVISEDGKMQHFIEIEVAEHNIHELTEDECWEIIKKYEEKLSPLGITPQKRLRKSLFEMYKNG